MAEESNQLPPFVPKKPAIKMPPGYRFRPTDEELVIHYLKPKAYNQPLQPNIIEEVELYSYNPDALTEDPNYERKGVSEWYFFTPRERKYRNGERPKRTAGDGFWKATGADKKVKIQGKTVGLKKTLVYYLGKPPSGNKKTNWIMHEFVLSNPPPRQRAGIDDMRLDDWVLCRIYKNNKNLKGASESSIGHDQKQNARQPQAETKVEQDCGNIPPAEMVEKEQQNGSIPPRIEQFHQVGDYNNNMLPQQQAHGMLLYNDNGYGASTSGLPEFPQSLDHYHTMFSQQAVSGWNNFIPRAAPLSSIPPAVPVPSITPPRQYPLNMIHEPFPSLPNFFFSEEDGHLLNMDLGSGI